VCSSDRMVRFSRRSPPRRTSPQPPQSQRRCGHAAGSSDGHVWQVADRLASARARRAAAPPDVRAAGTPAPVPKYISSGVLSAKRRMRQHAVVDVERHESTDGGDAVERVEEKPLMFERPPPRLDHGVRELQLREGQHTAQDTPGDQFVDLGVHVLDPVMSRNSLDTPNVIQLAFNRAPR